MAIGSNTPPTSAAGRFKPRGTFHRTPPIAYEDPSGAEETTGNQENTVSAAQPSHTSEPEPNSALNETTAGPLPPDPNQGTLFEPVPQASNPTPISTEPKRRGRRAKLGNTSRSSAGDTEGTAFSASDARARIRELEQQAKAIKAEYVEAMMRFQAQIAPLREEHDRLNRDLANWTFDV